MTPKFLITTALEETWQDVGPILFLSEACCVYDRREKWQKFDHIVVPFHWNDRSKLLRDYAYLDSLYERLLSFLSEELNAFHSVGFSERYWRILIGPWLAYFCQIIFERWEAIATAFEKFEINNTVILELSKADMIPSSMEDFVKKMQEDTWNHFIYGEILKVKLGNNKKVFKKAAPPAERSNDSIFEGSRIIPKYSQKIKDTVRSFAYRNNKIFICSSSLGVIDEAKLCLRFAQIPVRYSAVQPKKTSADMRIRDSFVLNVPYLNDFENFLVKNIPYQIPICFLEGYAILQEQISKLPWPKKPLLIFTSNILLHDTVAMTYAAYHMERCAKLMYAQHGGLYGQAEFMWAEEHELKISNRFFTWGWKDRINKKVTALGILKRDTHRPIYSSNAKKHLLLILPSSPRYTYRLDSSVNYVNTNAIQSQIEFARSLPESISKGSLLIRLYGNDEWKQKEYWLDAIPNIMTNSGKNPIEKLIRNTRLIIYAYNSTGYLEYLSRNIPTIVFFNNREQSLRESALPFFEDLKNVGIFHNDALTAANHVSTIWDDVDHWWQSEKVQLARVKFCQEYAYLPDNLNNMLEKIFRAEMQDK
jgi:putative transferase (TIGR04331 family)